MERQKREGPFKSTPPTVKIASEKLPAPVLKAAKFEAERLRT